MQLTTTKKIMVGIKIFFLLVLLDLIGSQFIVNRTDLDLRRALTLSPAAVSQPTEPLENDTNLTPIIPEPTPEPTPKLFSYRPRQTWVGWVIIAISSLLLLEGLDKNVSMILKARSAKSNSAGFSLNELLIVIGIIGIIAGILLVATGDARGKARMATLYAFSGSVYRLLGADCVGQWEFNEGSGTTTQDRCWGFSLDITPNGPTWTNAGTNHTSALDFDGYDDVLRTKYYAPGINPNIGLTIEAFVNSHTLSENDDVIVSGGSGVSGRTVNFFLSRYGSRFRFGWVNSASEMRTIDQPTGAITANEWYHVLATHDGTQARLYMDGKIVASSSSDPIDNIHPILPGPRDTHETHSWEIGRFYTIRRFAATTDYFDGLIDALRIYNAPLPEK